MEYKISKQKTALYLAGAFTGCLLFPYLFIFRRLYWFECVLFCTFCAVLVMPFKKTSVGAAVLLFLADAILFFIQFSFITLITVIFIHIAFAILYCSGCAVAVLLRARAKKRAQLAACSAKIEHME